MKHASMAATKGTEINNTSGRKLSSQSVQTSGYTQQVKNHLRVTSDPRL